jgi:hypothetical protein
MERWSSSQREPRWPFTARSKGESGTTRLAAASKKKNVPYLGSTFLRQIWEKRKMTLAGHACFGS